MSIFNDICEHVIALDVALFEKTGKKNQLSLKLGYATKLRMYREHLLQRMSCKNPHVPEAEEPPYRLEDYTACVYTPSGIVKIEFEDPPPAPHCQTCGHTL